MDKLSYALGMSMGHNFKGSGIKAINADDFAAGVAAVYDGTKPAMSYDEAKRIVQDFFTNLEKEMQAEAAKAGAENLKIRSDSQRRGRPSGRIRPCRSALHRQIDRRHRIRQFRGTRRAGNFRRHASDPRMGRSIAADARRRQMETLHSLDARLWRKRRRRRNRPEHDAHFRCRTFTSNQIKFKT